MFIKNNILYADAYMYLKHKTKPIIGLSISLDVYSSNDFLELPMSMPLSIEVENEVIYWQHGLFANRPAQLTYADIKTSIIKSRYSDDDQMALILNKDKSPEDLELFQKMQEWRDFAGYIAKDIISAE